MRLIEIARTYRAAPEGAAGTAGAGAQPAAGAGAGTGAAAAGAAAGAAGGQGAAAGAGSVLGAAGAAKGADGAAAGAAGAGASKGADGGQGADGAAAKAKDGAQAAELEVKLPEGVKVDEKLLGSFKEVAQKAGMNSEQASAVAKLFVDRQQAEVAAWQDQGKAWGEQLHADKEFGGDHFAQSSADAQRAVLKFGGPELANELEKYGIGNLPALAKAFAKVGKAMGDDKTQVTTAGESGKKPLTGTQRISKMYDAPDSQRARGQ